MANDHNLINLGTRTKKERTEIARLGGVASGKIRRKKRQLNNMLNYSLFIDNFRNKIKGYHFRNGKVSDKQEEEIKAYLKRLYHIRKKELKQQGATKEELEEFRLDYEETKRDIRDIVIELHEKQKYILGGKNGT